MPSTVAGARRQAEVQTRDLPMIGATPKGQPTVNCDAGDWILPILMRALDRTMARKEAAIVMGMDAAQLSRQGGGDGHLSVRRLGALGETYWLAVAEELRIHFGVLERAELIAQAEALSDRARQLFAQAAQR